jgi:hypothetical protein
MSESVRRHQSESKHLRNISALAEIQSGAQQISLSVMLFVMAASFLSLVKNAAPKKQKRITTTTVSRLPCAGCVANII